MTLYILPLPAALQTPTSARAVWIIGKDSFHICWNYLISSLPQVSHFRILNSRYEEINNIADGLNKPSYYIDIAGQRSGVDFVLVQVVPPVQMQKLPTRPLKISVSGQ